MRSERHFHRQNIALAANSLFPFYDTFSASVINPRWIGSSWALAGGGVSATPVITGAELIVNSGFEGVYVGGVAPNWTLIRGTPLEYLADPHGGTKSQELQNPAGNNGFIQQTGSFNCTNGKWYQTEIWTKLLAANGQWCYFQSGGSFLGPSHYFYNAPWTKSKSVISCTFTGAYSGKLFTTVNAVAGASDIVYDDISVKEVSFPSILLLTETGVNNLTIEVEITMPNNMLPGGLVLCVDSFSNPQNFIQARILKDQSTASVMASLTKCVAGSYLAAPLINQAIVYAAGRKLKVVKNGTTVQLFYNGVQVGADQNIADAGIINNTKHGFISTDPSTIIDNIGMY